MKTTQMANTSITHYNKQKKESSERSFMDDVVMLLIKSSMDGLKKIDRRL